MFNTEAINSVLEKIRLLLNDSNLTLVELSYLASALMQGIGESAYDKNDLSYESVLSDYRKSPSFPAALIVHADQIHRIHELFIREINDASLNADEWNKIGEMIPDE